jgi:hypothetical protein
MSPHVATNSSVTMSSTLTMSRSGTMNNQVTMRRNGAMSRRVGIATIALALASGLTAALSILWRGDLATTTVITPRGELVELVTTGVYAHNSLPVVAEGLGWDLVTLVLAAPALLGCSLIAMRGSRRALYASLGLVTYLFYQYLMYATYWAFGPLFLMHVALYAVAIVLAFMILAAAKPARQWLATPAFPRRVVIGFCFAVAMVLIALWGKRIATAYASATPQLFGTTTLTVQALDLGLMVPLAFAVAVLLIRRHGLGIPLSISVLVHGVAMFTAILAMVLVRWAAEGVTGVEEFAVFVALDAVSLGILARALRTIPNADRPIERRDAAEPAGGAGITLAREATEF